MIGNYRGKRLFAGRLFVGRLFGPAPSSIVSGGAPRAPRSQDRRLIHQDDEEIIMLFAAYIAARHTQS